MQIPPFSPITPWLSQDGQTVNWPHAEFLIALQRAAQSGVQIVAVPPNSAAAGQAGNIAMDANWLYFYVSSISQWRRVAASAF